MPSKELSVTITTPICELNPVVPHNATVADLFNSIRSSILLRELWYFGLQYESKGVMRYADRKKKVTACANSDVHQLKFRLRPRFYPKDVSELIEDITRKLFYYEVKEQIISGQVYCPGEIAILLASYQAVVCHGKYDPNFHKPGYLAIKSCIPAHIHETHKLSNEQWEKSISAWHAKHGHMMEADAITEYLKIAQDLDMYGVTYYSVKNKNKTPLWLGISPDGLNFYEHKNKLTAIMGLPWGEIKHVSFFRTKFTVKPIERGTECLEFYCESTVDRDEIFSCCTGNRSVHSLRRDFSSSADIQQMMAQAKEVQLTREAERNRLTAEQAAREAAERQVLNLQHALHEQQKAFERSQAMLTTYQQKVKELEEQLEEERKARLELETMQHRLKEVNEHLERESTASAEERAILVAQKEAVMDEIRRQQELISLQEGEKLRLEAEILEANRVRELNESEKSDEHEVQFPEDSRIEEVRDARTTTDIDYAKQLELLRKELDAVKDKEKLHEVDILYDENLRQGIDKYRTLRQIRQGNTKKRAEQFESL